MKIICTTITMFLISLLGFSQDSTGTTITVTIQNIKNDNGHVLIGLHSSDTFMKGKDLQGIKSAIKEGKVVVTFENVAPGTYAILAMHDANDNGRMDYNDGGMPMESYGMSNNFMGFGPPQFSDAKFEVGTEPVTMEIQF